MQLPEPIGRTTVTQRASDRFNCRARHATANQNYSAVCSPGPSRRPEKGPPGPGLGPFPPRGYLERNRRRWGRRGCSFHESRQSLEHASPAPSPAEGAAATAVPPSGDPHSSVEARAHKELRVPPTAPFHRKEGEAGCKAGVVVVRPQVHTICR